jgi:hypothetical protein
LSQIFSYLSCPTSVAILWRTDTCIYVPDCAETVYELPFVPNKAAMKHYYTNRNPCEVPAGYLSLRRRPGGDWANTWHWTKCFTVFFSKRHSSSLSYFQIFFLITFLL